MDDQRTCDAGPEQTLSFPAPDLPYLPPKPSNPNRPIVLIGCGGIAPYHLTAYRHAGFRVVALCDAVYERAVALRDEYYPDAMAYKSYHEALQHDNAEIADIATHPDERLEIIEQALLAGKHVLSQKPFVMNLDDGLRLSALAEGKGLRLAVNQNGRWAPHFSYIREAARTGTIGTLLSARFSVHWNHDWTADTPFNEVRHLILFDFGIHWFDMAACLFANQRAVEVYATESHATGQRARPPMLAQACVTFEKGQASLAFDGFTPYGAQDRTFVVGVSGTISSLGPDLNHQRVTLRTGNGVAEPDLEGRWFDNGFEGSMAELMCAIDEAREPLHTARANLESLALCFAAVASTREKRPVAPWSIRVMND